MANYLLGDLQGCSEALERMLGHLSFSPSRDRLYVLGDLVNRGPDSAGVLRRLRALEGAALVLLGNHDLHALPSAWGCARPAPRTPFKHCAMHLTARIYWPGCGVSPWPGRPMGC